MRKGNYLSVPNLDAEKQPWYSEKYKTNKTTTTSPLIRVIEPEDHQPWNWTHFFMTARQKEKSTRRSIMRSRTKGIKLLFTLLFCTVSMYFIHRFIANYMKANIPSETVSDLFKSVPSSDHIKQHFLDYTKSDHHRASSSTDKALATWTRDRWIQYGVTDTSIETYWPLLNYPKHTRLAILSSKEEEEHKVLYEANLDVNTNFHAFAGHGNVTGPVIYANYGRLTDFQFLSVRGIQINGTIALIRHGVIEKGMKVKMAEDFGCIGVILYEDPEEQPNLDSTKKPPLVQQGNVMYSSFITGDPLTQGYAATENATKRITYEEATGIPKIPSLPVSWKDAQALLNATEGFGIESDLTWLGGLCGVHYFSGPSKAQVNLINFNTCEIKPIWNVVGKIPGSTEPDRAIVIGNHRDAWHTGAMDPGSGSAVLMELVRTMGVLMNRGWRPKRTLIIASWDAQEYGMIGSTEWVEDHQSWLREEAIAYLDVDYAVSGKHFTAQASPLLHQLLYQVTKEVIDPQSSTSVYDVWKSDKSLSREEQAFYFESSPSDSTAPLPLPDILGSNGDYSAFFNHLGISSMSFGFRSPEESERIGTRGDTVDRMLTDIDPTFEYHQTLTKIWGLLVFHLSSDLLLPMQTQDYTTEIIRHLSRLSARQGCSSFPFLSSVLHSFSATSLHFDKKRDHWSKQLGIKKHISRKLKRQVAKSNERVVQFERAFIDHLGMSAERPWFKHVVFGPQLNTGVPQAFPGLAEAVDAGDAVSIKFIEERIGKLLLLAERALQGQLDDEEDDDEFDSLH